MPELTGHSLEDIERKLHEGHFRPRDFASDASSAYPDEPRSRTAKVAT
jgi:hypothetical protein